MNLFKDSYKVTNASDLAVPLSNTSPICDCIDMVIGFQRLKRSAYASENILQIIKYEIYRQETIELGIYLVADRWKTHERIRVRLRGLVLAEAAENDERLRLVEKDHLLIFLLAVKIAL